MLDLPSGALKKLPTRTQRNVARKVAGIIHDIPVGSPLPPERELADRCQVSRPTLRRVLRQMEEKGLLLTLPKRGRIVSGRARPDASRLDNLVAVLARNGEAMPGHYDARQAPGWAHFVSLGVQAALHEEGYHTLACNQEQFRESQLRPLIESRPIGIIVPNLEDEAESEECRRTLATLGEADIHVVVQALPASAWSADTVDSDQAAGARMLTEWLLARGRRRILRLWHRAPNDDAVQPRWLTERNRGVDEALLAAGVAARPPLLVLESEYAGSPAERFEQHVRLTAGYLAEEVAARGAPDAIMAASDGLVPGIVAACRLLGMEPGRDVVVTGYDHYWWETPCFQFEPMPPAVTVDKLNARIGRELVDVLLRRRAGAFPHLPVHRLVRPELIDSDAGRTDPRP